MHREAIAHLSEADPILGRIIAEVGPCRLKPDRSQSAFEALVEAVCHQQLTGKAAQTILGRVKALHPATAFPNKPTPHPSKMNRRPSRLKNSPTEAPTTAPRTHKPSPAHPVPLRGTRGHQSPAPIRASAAEVAADGSYGRTSRMQPSASSRTLAFSEASSASVEITIRTSDSVGQPFAMASTARLRKKLRGQTDYCPRRNLKKFSPSPCPSLKNADVLNNPQKQPIRQRESTPLRVARYTTGGKLPVV